MYLYIQNNKNFLYADINNIILSYLGSDVDDNKHIFNNCLLEMKIRRIFDIIFDRNSRIIINL